MKLFTTILFLAFLLNLTKAQDAGTAVEDEEEDQEAEDILTETTGKLKNNAVDFSAFKPTREEVGQILPIVMPSFAFLDKDGDKSLTEDEFREQNAKIVRDDQQELIPFSVCDLDKSGDYTISEFASCAALMYGFAFATFDTDHNGAVDSTEADKTYRVMVKVYRKFTRDGEEPIQKVLRAKSAEMISAADLNNDGNLSKIELAKLEALITQDVYARINKKAQKTRN